LSLNKDVQNDQTTLLFDTRCPSKPYFFHQNHKRAVLFLASAKVRLDNRMVDYKAISNFHGAVE
jgi:hypothetical protein